MQDSAPCLLIFDYPSIAEELADAFAGLNYQVLRHPLETAVTPSLSKRISSHKIDYFVSINCYPHLLELCEKLSIPYISWIVDTPWTHLYTQNAKSPNHHIFYIDSSEAEKLKKKGYPKVHYLPLAGSPFKNPPEKNPGNDISFVGYTGKHNEFNLWNLEKILPQQDLMDIWSLFKKQAKKPFQNLLKGSIPPRLSQRVGSCIAPEVIFQTPEEKLTLTLSKKYHELERRMLLQSLTAKWSCRVYGDENWKQLENKNLHYMGLVQNRQDLSSIFRSSKINLNHSRIYAESGLPLRVFEVLSSGGFLLSNDKEDLSQLFTPGKDLVIFRDLTDLHEILSYYLHHEEERYQIARQGYESIRKRHNYKHRAQEMMELVTNRTCK